MVEKQKISRADLRALLMKRVREHPGCAHVVDVTLTRPLGQGWGAAFVSSTNETVCAAAFRIARELQAEYDLE